MATVPPLWERIRTAVADAYTNAAWQTCNQPPKVYVLNAADTAQVDVPCIVVSYELGSEQDRGGTNQDDYFAFPLAAGYFAAGPINDETQGDGPTIAEFRDVSRALFHHKTLPGVPEVYETEFNGQPAVQRNLPGFEQLATVVGVTAVAQVPRTVTWST